MREYAGERGVPATPGETTLEVADGVLTATTSDDGVPVIRTRARVGEIAAVGRGAASLHHRHERQPHERPLPLHAELVQPWEVLSFEFLAPDHSLSALRPADPLEVTWGFYSPNASFCYASGEEPIG
jgi:hypothetical protein